jgi:hypothetical protein
MSFEQDRRLKLYRALLGTPPAIPGVAGKRNIGQSNVSLGDHAPFVKGALRITCKEKATGRETVLLDEKNLVVTQAAALMAAMAAGSVNSEIGYIELGDPAPAVPPALSDTTLQQTTGQMKAIAFILSGGTVSFSATWGVGEGNGLTYTEAGLFTNPFAAGTMFARKTGFSILKTAAFSLTFTWMLTFSVVDACQEACYGVALVGSSYIVEDYIYDAVGGESQVIVPIDFVVGAKRLEVFLNGSRLYYTRHYIEAIIGASKGITLIGFTLLGPGLDDMYFVHKRY